MKTELFQKLLISYLNIPYVFGGKNDLVGLDCSGLMCEILKALGVLKTNDEFGSQQLYDMFKPKGSPGVLEIGSFAFYGTGPTGVDHIAMFIDDTHIIEAGHGTAQTLNKQVAAERGAYVRLRPYNYRADLIEIFKIDLGLVP